MIEILDTTLRDGEQTPNISFNSKEKLKIVKELFSIGIPRLEVASSLAVDEDKKAVKLITKHAKSINKLEQIEVLGFINKKSIDWISETNCKTVNLLAKGSEKHCELQLKKTLKEHLTDIEKITDYALTKNIQANIYLEDWSSGMINSKEYVFEMIENLTKLPIKRIMLPDTLGILSPDQTFELLKEITTKFPQTHFDYHAHNDYNLATANTLQALKTNIKGIHVTVNSLGERTGNCDLFSITTVAKDFLNIDFKLKEEQFYNLSKLIELSSKIEIPKNHPIIGENVHQQTSGIHADGDKKGDLYKTKLKAERFGKEQEYALGKQSGSSTILINLKKLGIKNPDETKIKDLTIKIRKLGEEKKLITKEDLLKLYNQ